MSEGQLPSNVHVLKPRTMSISDRLDRFLETHALAPNDSPTRRDPRRPRAPRINAITCARCGQAEYLTRDYCRCGHYLRGQLEDEFFAWEAEVHAKHEKLANETSKKLKPLRVVVLASLPFLVGPMLHLAFWSDGFSIHIALWLIVGFALLGAAAMAELVLWRPVEASRQFLRSFTFETFVEDRIFKKHIGD